MSKGSMRHGFVPQHSLECCARYLLILPAILSNRTTQTVEANVVSTLLLRDRDLDATGDHKLAILKRESILADVHGTEVS